MHNYGSRFLCSDPDTRGLLMTINQITSSTCNYVADFTADDNFSNALESNVNIKISKISISDARCGNIHSKKIKQVESATLAKNCYIDLGKAKKTVIRTTQRWFWSCLHLTMGRLYPTNEK